MLPSVSKNDEIDPRVRQRVLKLDNFFLRLSGNYLSSDSVIKINYNPYIHTISTSRRFILNLVSIAGDTSADTK